MSVVAKPITPLKTKTTATPTTIVWWKVAAALVFSCLVVMVDWESLQGSGSHFIDRKNYYDYFKYEENVLSFSRLDNFYHYVSREFLWHYGIDYLVNIRKIPIDYVFNTISFFCLFVFSLYILKYKSPAAILLLLNPLVITLVFSQLRSALAVSILLACFMSGRRFVYIAGVVISPLIHTASVIVIAMYFASRALYSSYRKKRFGSKTLYALLCFLGLSVSVVTGPLRTAILGYFDDRRAGMGDAASSLAYTIYWVGLLAVCAIQKARFFNSDSNRYAVIILAIASTSLLTGSYTTRFVAMFFPLMITTMLNVTGAMRMFVVGAYLCYATLQWIYWLRIGWS